MNSRDPENQPVVGLGLSAHEMAILIADALIDGGIVKEADRSKCEAIASEELWIRKVLVDGHQN